LSWSAAATDCYLEGGLQARTEVVRQPSTKIKGYLFFAEAVRIVPSSVVSGMIAVRRFDQDVEFLQGGKLE